MNKVACVCSTTNPHQDKRVRRHIEFLLSQNYDVFTVGLDKNGFYGDGRQHHSLNLGWLSKFITYFCKFIYPLRTYAHKSQLSPQICLQIQNSDLLLVNDADTLHLVEYMHESSILWLDCHEFAPLQYDNDALWLLFFGAYNKWAFSYYLRGKVVDVFSTVSEEILCLYKQFFYFCHHTVVNYLILENSESIDLLRHGHIQRHQHYHSIKLVYHGNLGRRRKIDDLIVAISQSTNDLIMLDIFSTGSKRTNSDLQKLIDKLNLQNRVFIYPPLAYNTLFAQGSQYSFGICMFPPVTTNLFNAAPNKLYIYILAGLPILTYPSPTISALVNRFSIGRVTKDFSITSLTALLDDLTIDDCLKYKLNLRDNISDLYCSLHLESSYKQLSCLL